MEGLLIRKQPYDAPEVEVIELKSESIICTSGEDYKTNPPQNW